MMDDERSIVEYFYESEEDRTGSRCGYCHSSDTGYSKGMWGHQVTCQDYQDLIDRGWRRSGKYLYKPTMRQTCCPAYTIRCDALNFKPSKSHKKVIKKVTTFLADKKTDETDGSSALTESKSCPSTKGSKFKHVEKSTLTKEEGPSKEGCKKTLSERKVPVGPDPNKPPCRKAKLIRKEKKLQKLAAKEIEVTDVQPKQNEEKSLEELLSAHLSSPQSAHKLEIKLVRVDMDDEEFVATLSETHTVFVKYQMDVHKEQSFECGFNQFKRFLVDSPLIFEQNATSPSPGWGSFHQQYYIDGKLIAVGVLDILPDCVSSVYFFYDTDYSFLSLGVYSALRELQFTRELNRTSSQLKYYYMGFYIHSCPKMRYKANYSPSYLACPETYSWIPVEKCSPKLDVSKYSRLDETDKEDPTVELSTVLVLVPRRGLMPYNLYRSRHGSRDDEEVREYAQLVGPKVSLTMALCRR